jgi:tripartite ATP-independent transporter DctM subunit
LSASLDNQRLPAPPFAVFGWAGRGLLGILALVEYISAIVLAIDVAVVFASVICRYFLQQPLDWAEEVARAMMVTQVFLGAAGIVGRGGHAGIDAARGLFPARWRPYLAQFSAWIIAAVAAAIFASAVDLLFETEGQTTPFGLPGWIFIYPVMAGGLIMTILGVAVALAGPARTAWMTFGAGVALLLAVCGWNAAMPAAALSPFVLLSVAFLGSLVIGVPIAFALALSALVYFLADPSLPMSIYSQQLMAGSDHFVLLAVPFFVLAGLAMEANGMSARLIELLLRMMGRLRGGLNLIIIVATAFFSGISGSKLADIAAVGGIIMPAVRKTGQDPNEAAGLLASSAIMAETIPPCVNMIIFGFVANVSIGGLFIAGIVPAVVLAAGLAALAVAFGKRIDPNLAFATRTPLPRLIAGALVALAMVGLIGRGVTSGVATSTEISAFAVVYALVIGGLAFGELTPRSLVRLFVRSASMASGILFIVAAASSFSFALTIEQIPHYLSDGLTAFGEARGSGAYLVAAAALMIGFGSVLEGAPALIIWGPLLTPIAQRLGVNPLHFGTVMVIAMGLGLFSPPLGLGLYATCAITGTETSAVARPMLKYLAVLAVGLALLIFVPEFSLWLPGYFGLR